MKKNHTVFIKDFNRLMYSEVKTKKCSQKALLFVMFTKFYY